MRIVPVIALLCLVLSACGGGSSSSSEPSEPGELQVTSVSPGNGTVLGGTRLTIKGSGFSAGVTSILIGRNPGTEVSASNDTTAYCDAPASNRSGTVDVTVETSAGSATLAGGYRYNNRPSVLAVVPPAGFAYGQLTVSIVGFGFQSNQAGLPTVYFGDTMSLLPQVVNDTLIFATTPPLPPGAVDVTVVNANGEDTLRNGFLYLGSLNAASTKPDGTLEAQLETDEEPLQRWRWPNLFDGRAIWERVDED